MDGLNLSQELGCLAISINSRYSMFRATQQTSHKKSFRIHPKGLENIVLYSVKLLFISSDARRRYKLI